MIQDTRSSGHDVSLSVLEVWESPRPAGHECPSPPVDVDDGLGKGLRRFLRQVVPDAARDDTVLILAREFLRIGTGRPGAARRWHRLRG